MVALSELVVQSFRGGASNRCIELLDFDVAGSYQRCDHVENKSDSIDFDVIRDAGSAYERLHRGLQTRRRR